MPDKQAPSLERASELKATPTTNCSVLLIASWLKEISLQGGYFNIIYTHAMYEYGLKTKTKEYGSYTIKNTM